MPRSGIAPLSSWSTGVSSLDHDTRIAAIFSALTFLALAVPSLKYAGYLCAVAAVLLVIYRQRVLLPEVARPFVFLIVVGLITLPFGTLRGAKDVFFIFSGVSIALVIGAARVRPWWITSALIFTFLATVAQNPDALTKLDVRASTWTFEGSISFVFGLLSVWALSRRQWVVAALALVLAVLTLKRIAVLGVILCFTLWMLPTKPLRLLLHPVVMVAANAIGVIAIMAYAVGDLDQWIATSMDESANAFGMGRQTLLAGVSSDILGSPLSFVLFGKGPGAAYETLSSPEILSLGEEPMLHSDVLKLLYDYGALVFCGFFYLMYRTEDLRVKLLSLYCNVTFLSDNTLVYHFFMMPFFMLALCRNEVTRLHKLREREGS